MRAFEELKEEIESGAEKVDFDGKRKQQNSFISFISFTYTFL